MDLSASYAGLSEQMVKARWKREAAALFLCDMGLDELKWRYLPECVGFLYTVKWSEPSEFLLTKMVINDQLSFTDLSISTPPVRRFCLPYINGWSEAVARICIEFDIQLTHRPINKLRYVWGNHKSYLPSHKNRNSIYQINCSDCSMLYIGESNNASRRLKEHEADFRLRRLNNSALASHALSLKHTPNFDSHKVLANDCFYRTRKFSESFFIQDTTNVMNIHPGSLPSSFLNSNLFKNFWWFWIFPPNSPAIKDSTISWTASECLFTFGQTLMTKAARFWNVGFRSVCLL